MVTTFPNVVEDGTESSPTAGKVNLDDDPRHSWMAQGVYAYVQVSIISAHTAFSAWSESSLDEINPWHSFLSQKMTLTISAFRSKFSCGIFLI